MKGWLKKIKPCHGDLGYCDADLGYNYVDLGNSVNDWGGAATVSVGEGAVTNN